jgi:hypothetical protein
MKADQFTKIVLTIIAVNLTFLTLNNMDLFPKAYAKNAEFTELKTEKQYGLVPLNADGSISVKLIASDELDVNIVGIDTYDDLDVNIARIQTNDELDINIDEVGGSWVSSGGPISVEID